MKDCWSFAGHSFMIRQARGLPALGLRRIMTPTINYEIAQLDALDPVRCPCGWSRRAFANPESQARVPCVEILEDPLTQYQKTLTETSVVLEGGGYLDLDGEPIPLKPSPILKLHPGRRLGAEGNLRGL